IMKTRRWIFEKGYGPGSKHIANVLDHYSLVPSRSAFSIRLSEFGFDFYPMFVVDLIHEFELGVWKAILTHLLQILYAEGNNTIQRSNKRHVLTVPTFGRDTVRHFGNNVSGLKKLAACDYEDILQVYFSPFCTQQGSKYDCLCCSA
ncbi:uncharacterized protein LAESUDRAFT_660054, partial [Laetiporus sulphureus 93-53]